MEKLNIESLPLTTWGIFHQMNRKIPIKIPIDGIEREAMMTDAYPKGIAIPEKREALVGGFILECTLVEPLQDLPKVCLVLILERANVSEKFQIAEMYLHKGDYQSLKGDVSDEHESLKSLIHTV